MCAEFERRSRFFVDGLNRIKGSAAACRKARSTVSRILSRRGGSRSRWRMLCWMQAGVAALSGTAFG